MKGLANKSAFVFITYGTIQRSCGNDILNQLQEKGAFNLGYFKSQGADYWIGYIKRGYLFSPDSPNAMDLNSAENFGKIVAARYTDNIQVPFRFDRAIPWMYHVEKMLVARPMAKIYSKMFSVDNNCNNCGICIKSCPVGNITENNGKPAWHSNCLLCASCELSCPNDAIHSAFDMNTFAPFMNYNIKHALRRNTPYRKVSHKNGKTIPVD
jgi:ferredoxin